ncbi:MAG: imidazole glycerol phosphate synthase subunit HisF [Candidatus Alcyoniella australis]|nr:imidazole glycerol phosphate synthase subunit HisF [Candidatus Alcyoniella australis]
MLAKRIVPCLDVDRGRVVKGVRFVEIRDVGDPVQLALRYDREGADELVLLDITASHEGRDTMLQVVRGVADSVFIPFTVGGGIRSEIDFDSMLSAGADKVAINTAAIEQPELIDRAAKAFGSQCVVVAIDARRDHDDWEVVIYGGRKGTGRKLTDWAREVCDRGAGEILLTSMDRDGTKLGFDLTQLSAMDELPIPLIASGGVGLVEHFVEVFEKTNADAALAASVFHFSEFSIAEVKRALQRSGVPIRPVEHAR